MKSLLDFIRYHNATPIIIGLVFFGAGVTLAANNDIKQRIFPDTESGMMREETIRPVDTTALLKQDFDHYDMKFRIDSVTQTKEAYQAAYSYDTYEISDTNVWGIVRKKGKIEVPKEMLRGRDLGVYISEQLGQVLDKEVAYLKEAKASAVLNITSDKTASKYASLVGKEFDGDRRALDGYKPVESPAEKSVQAPALTDEEKKRAAAATVAAAVQSDGKSATEVLLSQKEIRDMIVDAVTSFLAVDTTPTAPALVEPTAPTADTGTATESNTPSSDTTGAALAP